MIFCYTHRYGLMPCPLIIREASSCGRWERVQRPTARHNVERDLNGRSLLRFSPWSSGNLQKRGRTCCRNQRGWRKPGEDGPLNQLSRVPMPSQTLKSKHGACMGLYQIPCIYGSLGFWWDALQWAWRCLWFICLLGDPFLSVGYLCPALVWGPFTLSYILCCPVWL